MMVAWEPILRQRLFRHHVCLRCGSLHRHGLFVEVKYFPQVAIGVLEPMLVHPAIVLRLIMAGGTGGEGLLHQFIHLRPVISGKRKDHFSGFFLSPPLACW